MFTVAQWVTGVYLIRNTVNNKVYVGSASTSRGISKRWEQHKRELRVGKHVNNILQRSWNKYGEMSFEFSVLLYCHPDECLVNEQYFIDKYNAADRNYGYNIHPIAGSPRGVKRSDETKKKLSDIAKQRKFSPETRAKMSRAGKLKKPTVLSAEAREKIGAAKRGKKRSPEFVAKMTGRKLSDEHKAKLSRVVRKRSDDHYIHAWVARKAAKLARQTVLENMPKDTPPLPRKLR